MATGTAAASAGGGTVNRCATSQLQLSLGQSRAATGNEILSVVMTNRANSPCYLGGYPGVAMLNSGGNQIGDAQRGTDSFFGTYPPPRRVDLPPGGSTTFDLTWGGVDPCANGQPAQYPARLKITPPADYDSTTIDAHLGPVCPNTMVVHPVGSAPSR